MALWGTLWGYQPGLVPGGNPWGVLAGLGPEEACELSDNRVLVQMDDTVGNRDFRDLLCIFAQPFGHFNDVAENVSEGFNLETAVGEQLDFIGGVVGQARSGLVDDRYRVVLQIQSTILKGQVDGNWTGTVNDVLTIVRTFVGPGPGPILYTFLGPYDFQIDVPGGGLPPEEIQVLFRLLCRAIYAAVLGIFQVIFPGDNLWDSVSGGVTGGGIFGSVSGLNPGFTAAVHNYLLPTSSCE